MFTQLAMGVSGFVQRKGARDMDSKWTRLDEAIQPLVSGVPSRER